MNITSQIMTTVNINPTKDGAKLIFQHLDKYIIGDIQTLNKISEGENGATTYCSVPQVQAIFAFADLIGYLFRSNRPINSNPQNETLVNLEYFFTKMHLDLGNQLFEPEYSICFPLMKKVYRDGVTHQYFPKTTYLGITKILTESDPLFFQNSLNVKKLTHDVLKAYEIIKIQCTSDDSQNSNNLSRILLENWHYLSNKDNELLPLQFIQLRPDIWVPIIHSIRSNKPIRIVFQVKNDSNIISVYKQKKRKYTQDDQNIKESEDVLKNYIFDDSMTDFFVDHFDVKDLALAANILDDICPIDNPYLSKNIRVRCNWASDSSFYNYDKVNPDVEKYVYMKDFGLLNIVNSKIPASVLGFSGEVPKAYNNHFRKIYYQKYYNLTEMFELLDKDESHQLWQWYSPNKLQIPDPYYYYPKLPIMGCKNISIDELLKYEQKLDEVFLCSTYANGTRGREGETVDLILNYYAGLEMNENLIITADIYEFLENKRVVNGYVDSSTLNIIAKQLSEQRNIIYKDDGGLWIYPSVSINDYSLDNRYYGRFRFRDNFDLTEQQTFHYMTELSALNKPSIMRPFYKYIFNDEFINNLLVMLKQFGHESESWYKNLEKTIKN